MHSDSETIRYVDELILAGIKKQASDIHIEPFSQTCRIRYRQEGELEAIDTISLNFATQVTARLKLLASMNIAERRLPQDGKIRMHDIDIRVSTCPSMNGEKTVLRLLTIKRDLLDITRIGMTAKQQNQFIEKLNETHGLILVTGATGSGKTITLYSALSYLNEADKNIVSIEDPVEVELEGMIQIPVNTRIGLTFPLLLRAILRQDPDIIMVGEIRDAETAQIAVQAAQTGHLVLATFHANSAQGAITRLQGMGVPAAELKEVLLLVISQRLRRRAEGERTGEFELHIP